MSENIYDMNNRGWDVRDGAIIHRTNGEGLSFEMTFEQRWEGEDEESY